MQEKSDTSDRSVTYNPCYSNSTSVTFYDRVVMTFLNLILQSAFIPNSKVLTALLIAMPSLGKSTYLEKLSILDFVHYTNDITPKRILDFLEKVNNGQKKFLVIPDFINTFGHGRNTVTNTRSMLRSMTEEGITRCDVFGMDRTFEKPVKAGLITGITSDKFKDSFQLWRSDGFLSRLLPFSYSHSPETENSIKSNMLNNINVLDNFKISINKNPVDPIIPNELQEKITVLSYELTYEKYKGAVYRPLKQVITLCKSSAVLRDSKQVEEMDIDIIRQLGKYINRSQNPL